MQQKMKHAPQDDLALRAALDAYLAGGRVPFSEGYWQYREQFLQEVLNGEARLAWFHEGGILPAEYGTRLDERVVEYPWLLSHLQKKYTRLLDAGATLIYPFLLKLPTFRGKTIVVYTLAPEEWVYIQPNVSYVYGDLRETLFKNKVFHEIVCLSTLEHIGMDNTQLYVGDARYRENEPRAYRQVLREIRRLLVPGGRLYLTVPYGRYEHLGWLQQFDEPLLQDAIETFHGETLSLTFFKYGVNGWQKADAAQCADCRYFDVHRAREFEADYAAAARAVACVVLRKPFRLERVDTFLQAVRAHSRANAFLKGVRARVRAARKA